MLASAVLAASITQEPVLSTALWRGREAAVYLGSGVGTGSVTKGTAEEKTIHCLKQMIDKVYTNVEGWGRRE